MPNKTPVRKTASEQPLPEEVGSAQVRSRGKKRDRSPEKQGEDAGQAHSDRDGEDNHNLLKCVRHSHTTSVELNTTTLCAQPRLSSSPPRKVLAYLPVRSPSSIRLPREPPAGSTPRTGMVMPVLSSARVQAVEVSSVGHVGWHGAALPVSPLPEPSPLVAPERINLELEVHLDHKQCLLTGPVADLRHEIARLRMEVATKTATLERTQVELRDTKAEFMKLTEEQTSRLTSAMMSMDELRRNQEAFREAILGSLKSLRDVL
ncbi:uncharacterized protein C8Q71DRAFT_755843 [Rhodofomes roseus]|uniref:Uncharacterized protein n=1 Tax=Rhodofomes roseus TaxID=34475 RepID=A0ABQ8KKC5_9APHY|nr:uncharacterized protein C8Q71DRAFT_755843 [Rhodofomes roseus]KAH9838042.1 hypothetical protein C8Q71DRAFT_755843 [Rhodofomes roseus]